VLIASLIASTIAFFVASYFIKRWMDENDIPKGMTRNLTVFALAIAVAYGVGWLVDHLG
jgi:VIT1/CCC1 family predicted Fe2+/Mn2+ transporter